MIAEVENEHKSTTDLMIAEDSWMNTALPLEERFSIACGAIRFRTRMVQQYRRQLTEAEGKLLFLQSKSCTMHAVSGSFGVIMSENKSVIELCAKAITKYTSHKSNDYVFSEINVVYNLKTGE